jgi:hypothetical protein
MTPFTVKILGASHTLVDVLAIAPESQALIMPRIPGSILRRHCRGPSEKHFFGMQG